MEIAILVAAVAVIAFVLGFAVRGRSAGALSEQRPRPIEDERGGGFVASRALIARLPKPETVHASLRTGNKINAIRAFREQLNCGLKEAKDAVELMERDLAAASRLADGSPGVAPVVQYPPPAETPLPALSDAVSRKLIAALPNRALVDEPLRAGSKIGAIKAFRDQSHCGLREAKEAVELMERDGV